MLAPLTMTVCALRAGLLAGYCSSLMRSKSVFFLIGLTPTKNVDLTLFTSGPVYRQEIITVDLVDPHLAADGLIDIGGLTIVLGHEPDVLVAGDRADLGERDDLAAVDTTDGDRRPADGAVWLGTATGAACCEQQNAAQCERGDRFGRKVHGLLRANRCESGQRQKVMSPHSNAIVLAHAKNTKRRMSYTSDPCLL